MSQKGITFRLNSHITTIAIIIIASVVFINYHFTNKILVKKIEEGAVNQSNYVISRVSRMTVGTEEIARNVASQALYYNKNNDLDLFLHQVLKSNPVLLNVSVALINPENNDIQLHTTGNDYRFEHRRDSLLLLKFNSDILRLTSSFNGGFWSNPFYSPTTPSLLVCSYQIPVFYPDRNTVAGIVSCDISLNAIKEMLAQIKIGQRGYAYVIDQSGNLITHPEEKWILNRNIFLMFPKESQKLKDEIKKGRSGAFRGISEFLGNEESWFYFAPLAGFGKWYAIIVIPDAELFYDINDVFQKIIFVSVFGIIFLFLLNLFVFKRMLDPLIRVTYAIQRFTSIPGKPQKSTKDEIKMLAQSLEDWQAKYGLLIKNETKTASEKLKIEKDLKSAQEIQFNIVPQGKPDFTDHPEIDLFAVLKPAELIGGDLYDYFFIGKNHLLIAIGDVSGKGIPASLFMAIASTLIKSNAKILSSRDIVSKVNKELYEKNSNQYFVTLFLGILDVRYGVLDYCNAAHNFPYILHPDGSLTTLSKSHGLPLGIYNDKSYKSTSIELHKGDTLVLYTDGVINSTDSHKHHYGTEKLENNLKNLTNLDSEGIVTRLLKSIEIFEGENRQADDISLMAIKYLKK